MRQVNATSLCEPLQALSQAVSLVKMSEADETMVKIMSQVVEEVETNAHPYSNYDDYTKKVRAGLSA